MGKYPSDTLEFCVQVLVLIHEALSRLEASDIRVSISFQQPGNRTDGPAADNSIHNIAGYHHLTQVIWFDIAM